MEGAYRATWEICLAGVGHLDLLGNVLLWNSCTAWLVLYMHVVRYGLLVGF